MNAFNNLDDNICNYHNVLFLVILQSYNLNIINQVQIKFMYLNQLII